MIKQEASSEASLIPTVSQRNDNLSQNDQDYFTYFLYHIMEM